MQGRQVPENVYLLIMTVEHSKPAVLAKQRDNLDPPMDRLVTTKWFQITPLQIPQSPLRFPTGYHMVV